MDGIRSLHLMEGQRLMKQEKRQAIKALPYFDFTFFLSNFGVEHTIYGTTAGCLCDLLFNSLPRLWRQEIQPINSTIYIMTNQENITTNVHILGS